MKKTQFSFLLSGDQIYFDFPSLTAHQKKKKKKEKKKRKKKKKKKESEVLKKSHFGQIQVQFVLFKVSYRISVMKEHPL